MSQLTLFIPQLFAEPFARAGGGIDPVRWPGLALILAHSQERRLESTSIERNLSELCGTGAAGASAISVAALTASIDLDGQPPVKIMRADPVHLRVDPTQILLFDDPSIMPSAGEADSLIEELNVGLPDLRLSRGRHPARWYFGSERAFDTITSSPGAVSGRSISNFLPRGPGAREFAQMMNEAQMLLHKAAVNDEREARGVPAINSIWPWGGGGGHREREIAPPDFVVGDDVLTAGLARRVAMDWCTDLEPAEVLARLERSNRRGLVVIGSPTGCVETTDPIADVDIFEQRWSALLLSSLRRVRLGELQLVTDRQCYSLTRWDLFKFWRRPRASTEKQG